MKTIRDMFGCGCFICGALGVVGAIETNRNPIIAIVLFLIGLVLVVKGGKEYEESGRVNDYTRHDDTYWFFHHKR